MSMLERMQELSDAGHGFSTGRNGEGKPSVTLHRDHTTAGKLPVSISASGETMEEAFAEAYAEFMRPKE